MESNDIERLVDGSKLDGHDFEPDFKETHISWIVFTEDTALKIKKPVSFSFLDFSTLQKRKEICEREVKLNRRLADIYIDVVSIGKTEGEAYPIGEKVDAPIEYAVRMRRVDPKYEMREMLERDEVTTQSIDRLAATLARFHQDATVIKEPFDVERMKDDFNDLESVRDKIEDELGKGGDVIDDAIEESDRFLSKHRDLIAARSRQGFRRDLHGDFHAANIFLTEQPIIFDCIEFNATMRQLDILDEIAFFCMDMETRGRKDIAEAFLQRYQEEMGLDFSEDEWNLFDYYKRYRANVRAKVSALKDPFDGKAVERYLEYLI